MNDRAGDFDGNPSKAPEYFATGWTGGRNRWAIVLVVTMATFMEVLDTSIANVALPHIAGNLSVSQNQSTWVLTSYLVANAVVLPISGWLSTQMGRKRFYMTCVAMFTISSFLCGLAPTLGSLIFFRIVQGMSGGGLGPSEQAIMADTFPVSQRGMAMAVYGMAVILAPAIGPTLGGFITDNFSWRWVFFINIPVGIASLLLTNRIVTDPPHLEWAREHRDRSIDWWGLGLVATGLSALEYVLDKGQEDDWFQSPAVLGSSVVAAITLVAFVVWEWRHKNPIVDLRMFERRSFGVANLLILIVGVALFGSTVLLPQYLQVLMGYTALQSGLALSPGGFALIALLPIVGVLVSKVDVRALITFGFVSLSASLFYMAHKIDLQMDFGTALELRALQMAGLAFLFVPIQTLAYADVEPRKFNQVSSLMNLSRNMGGDIGIALVTTMIARRSQTHQAHLAEHASAYSPLYQRKLAMLTRAFEHAGTASVEAAKKASALMYRELVQQAAQLAYLDAFTMLAIASGLIVPLAWLATRPAAQSAPVGH